MSQLDQETFEWLEKQVQIFTDQGRMEGCDMHEGRYQSTRRAIEQHWDTMSPEQRIELESIGVFTAVFDMLKKKEAKTTV